MLFQNTLRTPPPPLHRMMMKIYRNLVLLVEFSRPTVTASPTSQQAPKILFCETLIHYRVTQGRALGVPLGISATRAGFVQSLIDNMVQTEPIYRD